MENRIKAVFILTLLLGNFGLFIYSLWLLWQNTSIPLGLMALSSGSVCFTFLIYIGTGTRPRTSRNLPGLLIITTCCSIGIFWLQPHEWFYWVSVVLFGTVGSWLYVFWYSKLNRNNSQLQPGDMLPSLKFFNSNNEAIQTADIDKALLLIFYRGNWCPLCTAQIREVAKHYNQLNELGYALLMISPQPQAETKKIAAQFDISLIFCEDRDNVTAKKLGIDHTRALPYGMEKMGYSPDAVFPTVIITDSNHKIIWLDQTDNYRVRPEPDQFIQIIQQHLNLPLGSSMADSNTGATA